MLFCNDISATEVMLRHRSSIKRIAGPNAICLWHVELGIPIHNSNETLHTRLYCRIFVFSRLKKSLSNI